MYWLASSFNKNFVPAVSWSTNHGIFAVTIGGAGSQGAAVPDQYQVLAYGEMPELSPDASRFAVLHRTGEYRHQLELFKTGKTEPYLSHDFLDLRVNWVEWPDPQYLYVYSSVAERNVYRFDLSTMQLTPVEQQYRSFPEQVSRATIAELHRGARD